MGVGINIKMERRPDVRAARQARDVFISTHVISSEVERSLHALCLVEMTMGENLFIIDESSM